MQILFNKTVAECRSLGRRGGRAHARNLRLKTTPALPQQPTVPRRERVLHSVHEDCLLLDRQFPWLVNAFVRRRSMPRPDMGAPTCPSRATVVPLLSS